MADMKKKKKYSNGKDMKGIRDKEDQILPQINSLENYSEPHNTPKNSEPKAKYKPEEVVNLGKISKDLKKIKRQNFITHCLLSALIFVTLTWQCGEISVLLSVKNKITNPLKTVGDIIKGKILRGKGKGGKIEGVTIGGPEMSNVELPLMQLINEK